MDLSLSGNPASPSVSDAELLREIAAGSSDGLATLYDRYASTLLALANRVLRSEGEAEEVLQEVFLHVWNRADRYDPQRSSVPTWLVLITRSRAIDRLRSRRVLERTLGAVMAESPSDHTSPVGARNVLEHERRQRVLRELQGLPPEQREVLELAFYRGMTQSEISSSTGIPLGTVKTRTLLAMKKLRQALSRDIRDFM
jgi:RNA polymerase sigma-70 factor (ECF subfamily)